MSPSMVGPLQRLFVFVLVVACLYLAQIVLIPIALAVLITFLLSPLATALQRRHVPRVLAVVTVVVLALTLVGGVGAVLVTQAVSLGTEVPKYQSNIKEKVNDIRLLGRYTGFGRVAETVRSAAGEAEREAARAAPGAKSKPPTPVVVVWDETNPLRNLVKLVTPWLEPLSRAGLVVLLVPFMLLAREEMRNRLLRLIGFGRLALTTRAMDEAGERVTGYLLRQSFVNALFGALVTVGLFLIGIPYAALFGFLAGTLRFVPYVGIWIGAAMPTAVAMAVHPGWTRLLLVIGLFLLLELFISGMLEVFLYARSAGVSEVGLLVAIAFWTWIWGPIGLVLATPLTVCIVVVAKSVPELEFLWILMGNEPAMSTDVAVYQRLLAGDQDEASNIVERTLAEQPRERVYDDVLLRALARAAFDHRRGRIDADEYRAVVAGVREIVEQLEPAVAEPEMEDEARVFGASAHRAADAAGLRMLHDLLAPARIALDVASPELLSAEVVRAVQAQGGDLVLIGALAPGGLAPARFLCKRLRASVPGVRIVVGRWCVADDVDSDRQSLLAAGADAVGTSLVETRDLALQYLRVRPELMRGQVA
jgi:predicted PurR-regulated permease PerM